MCITALSPAIKSVTFLLKGETNSDWKLCPKCKVRLQDLGFATSECSKCGAEINKNSEEQDIKKASGFSGNTTTNYINFDSKAYVKVKIIKELKQKNYNSIKHKIPVYVLEAAVDQFLTISEYKIHRGSVQRGLKGMLIKYKLDEHLMSKSTKITSIALKSRGGTVFSQVCSKLFNIPYKSLLIDLGDHAK